MTKETRRARLARKEKEADGVAVDVRSLLHEMVETRQMSPDAVLAGALGHVVAEMTAAMGGPATAAALRQVIAGIEHLPSVAAVRLAAMPTAGRA